MAGEQPGEPVLAGVVRRLGAVRGIPVNPPSGQRRDAEDLPATPILPGGKLAAPIVDNGAIGDNPACTRGTVAEQRGSDRRVDPVGADDDLRLEPLSADQPDRALSADFSRLGAEADHAGSLAGAGLPGRPGRPGDIVSGLDTIFLVAAVIAFTGSGLSLLLVRDRDIERAAARESDGRPAPEEGPLAAWPARCGALPITRDA